MPSLKGQSLSTCPTSSLRPKDAGRPPGFRQIGNDRNGCHKGFGLIHVNSINTPKNDRTITEDQNAECCRHVGNQKLTTSAKVPTFDSVLNESKHYMNETEKWTARRQQGTYIGRYASRVTGITPKHRICVVMWDAQKCKQ